MEDMLQDALDAIGATDEGWEVGGYGDALVCPHGDDIELDGRCSQGCVSPLREHGMI